MSVFKTFECLAKSNIEGIETLAGQFRKVSTDLKNKQADVFASRTVAFEADYETFMSHIGNLEVRVHRVLCTLDFL